MSIWYVSICTKDRLEPGFYTIFLSIFDRHCLRRLGASGDEGWQMVKAEGKLSHWFVRKRRVKFHAGRVANVLRKIFSHVFIAACDLWLFLIVMESVYTRYVNLNEIYMGKYGRKYYLIHIFFLPMIVRANQGWEELPNMGVEAITIRVRMFTQMYHFIK